MGSADDIELTTTLLGLYECAVSPEKYPDLAERLEACLAGEPDASVLDRLENHSGAIWEKAVDLFLNVESGAADETCLLTLSLSRGCLLPPAWEQFLDRVRADDATRLRTFLDGRSSGPERGDLLLRAEAGIDGREEVYLARKGDGAIRIHRLRSELAPEVEALIVSQFGVTRSELRVLRGLAVGKTLKDLARDGGKSIETIRSQAKSTAAKMGLSRQTENLGNPRRSGPDRGGPGPAGHVRPLADAVSRRSVPRLRPSRRSRRAPGGLLPRLLEFLPLAAVRALAVHRGGSLPDRAVARRLRRFDPEPPDAGFALPPPCRGLSSPRRSSGAGSLSDAGHRHRLRSGLFRSAGDGEPGRSTGGPERLSADSRTPRRAAVSAGDVSRGGAGGALRAAHLRADQQVRHQTRRVRRDHR